LFNNPTVQHRSDFHRTSATVLWVTLSTDALPDLMRRSRSSMTPLSTAERVARALRNGIAMGELHPGAQLKEETIAGGLGVSRNTVREAFTMLAAERLAERLPHRGVFVARLDADGVEDLYRVRLLVEPAAVRAGGTRAAVALMRDAVVDGQTALAEGRWSDVGSANQHFHTALVAMAGSERLDRWMEHLLAEMRLAFHAVTDVRALHEPYVAENAAICDLVEAGELDAAGHRLVAYLERSRADLLATLT
jgi:DNA-binding GntR family transcriptional regulator